MGECGYASATNPVRELMQSDFYMLAAFKPCV